MADVLARIAFSGEIVEWRGPAPFLFVPVPSEHVSEVRYAAREASYGWGCIPVSAQVGDTGFTTSLFPRGETYLVPVKRAVQRAQQVTLGDVVEMTLEIVRR